MLSHMDADNRPQAVDVSGKEATLRTAEAQALVTLPPEAAEALRAGALASKKGPVFDTAILAGVMAAKQTAGLIPLCHTIPLEDCKVFIGFNEAGDVEIRCRAVARHKTGVEMEALTGASVAALTVYDMCKALSHGIVIRETKLLSKTGGKHDYHLPGG